MRIFTVYLKKLMKRFLFFVTAVALLNTFPACKKTKEEKAEDFILKIMTEGRWYMYNYTEQGNDQTYQFAGYEFQFYENGSVDAINGIDTKSGTWKGDISTYSIIANFPSAGAPLEKLNNTWKITDSYINAVFAEASFGSSLNKMQLVKK